MIQFLKKLFKRQAEVVVNTDNSVECDNCNDYGYITITFDGCSADLICPKCNGRCNSNSEK